MAKNPLWELQAAGQSVWIDNLSRQLVRGGGLAALIDDDAVTGVTSNPTIFQKALAEGDAYDEEMRALWRETDEPGEVFIRLAVRDVTDACDLLRPTWERLQGRDGYVSIEVDPSLADDALATIRQAMALHKAIDRPNLLVKIPATKAGLQAIEEVTARGKSVNVTLIFSLERYAAVVESYLRGLERLAESGADLAAIHSVASFFVSRVDSEADQRLDAIGGEEAQALRGRLGIANARLAYQHYLASFSGPRWEALEARGASKQRPLWASTSAKDPAYRDTLYVEELVGPHTVNTMPEETLRAFADHGQVSGMTVLDDLTGARTLIAELRACGVDYDDVVAVLEQEGVAKFVASYQELLAGVEAKRARLLETPV